MDITVFLLLSFVFGLCVGSFLNVLIYRLPRSLKITGRSFCPKCRKKILWYDNIPLLSFILLGGRCRFCQSPISWQYPLVELVSGLATVFITFHLRGVPQAQPHLGGVLFYLFITYALIVIFVSDLRYFIIPDQVVIPGIILLGVIRFVGGLLGSPSGWEALLSAIGAAGFFAILVLVTRGKGMGWGDVKLVGFIGLILGFPKILVALELAFLTGAIAGVILVLLKRKTLKSQIPFGPFLSLGALLALIYGDVFLSLYFP